MATTHAFIQCASAWVVLLVTLVLPMRAGAQDWHAMPLVSRAARDHGCEGGEGAQEIRTLAISAADPDFLLAGTDVGGLYRSNDAGGHWQVCMVGWNARGANAFAIDPHHTDHILVVGANSMDNGPAADGVYLSTNRGASWKQVLPRSDGNEWRRDSIAFDPSSFDPTTGICTRAYFESKSSGLFASNDGGSTWTLVNRDLPGDTLKIHPAGHIIYLGDNSHDRHGFYKSVDGGKTFRKINDNYTLGVDVTPAHPDAVYIARWDKVLVSDDAGETFRPVGQNRNLPGDRPIQDVRVSPVDPKILACKYGGPQWWEGYPRCSVDGGNSWHEPQFDRSLFFLPFTQADEKCVFDPRDRQCVYSTCAGGRVMKSNDAGQTYRYSNTGINAVMLGGGFNFNPAHPDVVFMAFQDFAGALTTDGGRDWIFANPSRNGWGGFDYGGFAANAQLLLAGDASGWTAPRQLRLSTDGGKTFTDATDPAGKPLIFSGADVSCIDPANEQVLFASNFRSDDAGKSWTAMTDCDGVYITNPTTGALFGRQLKKTMVNSSDHGKSWTVIGPAAPGDIRDIAASGNQVFIAANDRLWHLVQNRWEAVPTPVDQYHQIHISTVAIDPSNPLNIYTGGAANLYASNATVLRSTDGGSTWTNLTMNTPLKDFQQSGGPHEVQWIRVHPQTHQAWVNGQCYGFWTIAPPG